MGSVGTRGARLEGLEPRSFQSWIALRTVWSLQRSARALVESGLSLGTGEKHLAAAQGKGGGAAQADFERCAVLRREWSNK